MSWQQYQLSLMFLGLIKNDLKTMVTCEDELFFAVSRPRTISLQNMFVVWSSHKCNTLQIHKGELNKILFDHTCFTISSNPLCRIIEKGPQLNEILSTVEMQETSLFASPHASVSKETQWTLRRSGSEVVMVHHFFYQSWCCSLQPESFYHLSHFHLGA